VRFNGKLHPRECRLFVFCVNGIVKLLKKSYLWVFIRVNNFDNNAVYLLNKTNLQQVNNTFS